MPLAGLISRSCLMLITGYIYCNCTASDTMQLRRMKTTPLVYRLAKYVSVPTNSPKPTATKSWWSLVFVMAFVTHVVITLALINFASIPNNGVCWM